MFRDNPNIRLKPKLEVKPEPKAEVKPPQAPLAEPKVDTTLIDFLVRCGSKAIELRDIDLTKLKTLDEMVTTRTMYWFNQCAQSFNPLVSLDKLVANPDFGAFVRAEHVRTINGFLELCGDSIVLTGKLAKPTDDVSLKEMVSDGTYINMIRHANRLGRKEDAIIDIIRYPVESAYFARFVWLMKRYENQKMAAFPSGANSTGTTYYRFGAGVRDMAQTATELNEIVAYFEGKKSINKYE